MIKRLSRLILSTDLAVGTTSTPHSSALADFVSTSKAFYPPRMTEVQRDAIASPQSGAVIYNTTTLVLNYYNGSVWGAISTGSSNSGGTTSLRWYQPDSNAAIKRFISASGVEVYDFSQSPDELEIWGQITVPTSYTAGDQITLKKGKFFSSVISGNVLFRATTYILKSAVNPTAAITGYDSTNTQQAVAGSANQIVELSSIDLTNASGQINSVAVAAQNTLLIRIIRDTSAETSGAAADASLIIDSFEPRFTV